MGQVLNKTLSIEEEIKIERIECLMSFLGKDDVINWVETGPFRFSLLTQSFSDKITNRIVAPSSAMINLFYDRLHKEATIYLNTNLKRSKIKNLHWLLTRQFDIGFLPPTH